MFDFDNLTTNKMEELRESHLNTVLMSIIFKKYDNWIPTLIKYILVSEFAILLKRSPVDIVTSVMIKYMIEENRHDLMDIILEDSRLELISEYVNKSHKDCDIYEPIYSRILKQKNLGILDQTKWFDALYLFPTCRRQLSISHFMYQVLDKYNNILFYLHLVLKYDFKVTPLQVCWLIRQLTSKNKKNTKLFLVKEALEMMCIYKPYCISLIIRCCHFLIEGKQSSKMLKSTFSQCSLYDIDLKNNYDLRLLIEQILANHYFRENLTDEFLLSSYDCVQVHVNQVRQSLQEQYFLHRRLLVNYISEDILDCIVQKYIL
jgi:hypothetical protein